VLIEVLALKKSRLLHCTYVECPDSFTYLPSVHGCYTTSKTRMNWTAAGIICRTVHPDAHLLVVNDAREQWAIAAMFATTGGSFCFHFLVSSLTIIQTVQLSPPPKRLCDCRRLFISLFVGFFLQAYIK